MNSPTVAASKNASTNQWSQRRRKPLHTRCRAISPVATHDTTFKRVVEAIRHAGVAADIDNHIRNHRREQPILSTEAWLVAAVIELGASGSYDRSKIWARIKGLTAAQQTRLKLPGLRTQTISYDACYKRALRIERALQRGWGIGDSSRDWHWFMQHVLTGSRMTDEADGTWHDPASDATSVGIDDTAYPSWGHKTGPNPTEAEIIAGITSCGTDPDARNGRRTPTDNQPDEIFYGYQVSVVVMIPEVQWLGDPNKIPNPSYTTPYIVDIDVRPANVNPGPSGYEAVVRTLAVAAITEVVADMGFTMKGESFVRRLHKLGIDAVMALPPNDQTRVDTHLKGRPQHAIIENAGTFFHEWLLPEWEVPPDDLSDDELRDWYARRLIWAYTTHQHLGGGDIQLRSPFANGRLTADKGVADTTDAMHVTKPPYASDAQQAHVTMKIDSLDRHQRLPYGTRAWWLAYIRRLIVETVNARLKSDAGLSNECCKAMGIAAHTMSAVLLAAAYNLDVTQRVADEARRDSIANDQEPTSSATHSDDEAITLQEHFGGPAPEPAARPPPQTENHS